MTEDDESISLLIARITTLEAEVHEIKEQLLAIAKIFNP